MIRYPLGERAERKERNMKRYEIRQNSGWNWNIKSPWVIVDLFSGLVVGNLAFYETKAKAIEAAKKMRLGM